MRSDTSGSGLGTLGAFGMGVALMYFLDPGRGARRRALVRDKIVHGLHKTEDAAETTARDLRNRAQGLAAEVRGPAARLLVGAAGGALALAGGRRRDALGAGLSVAGLALISRSATNIELRRLLGGGRRGIEVQKAINIGAPLDAVFAFFTDYDNFPRFMSHVREVRDTGDGRSHWVVDGPAGVPVEWDAVITKLEPNEVLAWKSVHGSVIRSAGIIRFAQNEDGTTRVDLKMTYNPPAGSIGHAASKLLRADPKKQLDDDLARAKTFLETGTPPHDAAQEAAAHA
jgi:uncharacterized membrane protein